MQLDDGIRAYLADRRAKGFAPATIRNEGMALRDLLAVTGNVEMKKLRPQHLDSFWARNARWSDGTQNRVRGHLSVFFTWSRARGYMSRDQDPLVGTRLRKVAPRHRVVIPQSSFETFLAGIGDPRARAAVALGLYTFARLSEIQGLRWQDVDLDKGEVLIYRQKTKQMDTLPVCAELLGELRRWRLAYAAKVGEEIQPGWFVIPGCTTPHRFGKKGTKGFVGGGQLTYLPEKRSNLTNTMTRVLKEAGYYQPHEGGHTLRRSGAIALYNQLASVGHDRSIRLVQGMLGHSSIQTTEVYLRLDLDRKVRNDLLAGRRMFPDPAGGQVRQLKVGSDGPEDAHRHRV